MKDDRPRMPYDAELERLEAEAKAAWRDLLDKLPLAMPGIILIVMTVVIFWSMKV